MLEGTGTGCGFSMAAFFGTGFWFPYRKMWGYTLIFYGIVIAQVLIETLFEEVTGREVPAAMGHAVNFITWGICGAYGNRWYLSFTQKQIARLKEEGLSQAELLEALAKRGGTNLAAGFGCIIGMFVVLFAIGAFLEFFAGGG